MSRIGNKHIIIPEGVEITLNGNNITAKGPKGTLSLEYNQNISVELKENILSFSRNSEDKFIRSIHGTTRALVNNMIIGVSTGFEKVLEISGVGYRAQVQGNKIVVSAGYSHPVDMPFPEGVTANCPTPTEIHIHGIDKQVVCEYAAEIREIRKPEPYKGKGIRYQGEYIRRKEGKKAK